VPDKLPDKLPRDFLAAPPGRPYGEAGTRAGWAAHRPTTPTRGSLAMTVEISLSEPEMSATDIDDIVWICICLSGSSNSLNAAITEFREATGR